jgi:hypothetical protein
MSLRYWSEIAFCFLLSLLAADEKPPVPRPEKKAPVISKNLEAYISALSGFYRASS